MNSRVLSSKYEEFLLYIFQSDLIPEENSNHLLMVLEPEAASVHCRLLETDDFVERSVKTTKEELHFRSGQKILVIDAGGKTSSQVFT